MSEAYVSENFFEKSPRIFKIPLESFPKFNWAQVSELQPYFAFHQPPTPSRFEAAALLSFKPQLA